MPEIIDRNSSVRYPASPHKESSVLLLFFSSRTERREFFVSSSFVFRSYVRRIGRRRTLPCRNARDYRQKLVREISSLTSQVIFCSSFVLLIENRTEGILRLFFFFLLFFSRIDKKEVYTPVSKCPRLSTETRP